MAWSRLFTAFIEHDGAVETVRTLQVSVGNGRYYGGGMAVEASASADDGRLDFYSLEVDHWWRLLALLPESLRRGTQGQWSDVRAFRTTEVLVRTSRPRPVNTTMASWSPSRRPRSGCGRAPSASMRPRPRRARRAPIPNYSAVSSSPQGVS